VICDSEIRLCRRINRSLIQLAGASTSAIPAITSSTPKIASSVLRSASKVQ